MKNVKINNWTLSCISSEAYGLLLENSRLNDVDFQLQDKSRYMGFILDAVGQYHCNMDCGNVREAIHAYSHAIKMWETYKRDYR